MKHLLLLISCMLTGFCSLSQPNKHNEESYLGYNINGKVKTCIQYTYEGTQANFKKDSLIGKTKSDYNPRGLCTGFYVYSPNNIDSAVMVRLYSYDGKGRIIHLDSHREPETRYVDSYDSKHRLVETYYANNHLFSHTTYKSNGKIDNRISYDNAVKLENRAAYFYDKYDNNIEEDIMEPNGSLESRELRKFDVRHNKTEEIIVGANNQRKTKQIFKYDKNDNLVMRIDSNIIYIRGESSIENVNNSVSQNHKNIVTYAFRYYSFDKEKNWLQKTELIDGVIDQIIKREIKYYH